MLAVCTFRIRRVVSLQLGTPWLAFQDCRSCWLHRLNCFPKIIISVHHFNDKTIKSRQETLVASWTAVFALGGFTSVFALAFALAFDLALAFGANATSSPPPTRKCPLGAAAVRGSFLSTSSHKQPKNYLSWNDISLMSICVTPI